MRTPLKTLLYSMPFFVLSFAITACDSNTGSENNSDNSNTGSGGGSGNAPTPTPDPVLPSDTLPPGWYLPPGELIAGSSSVQTSFGYTITDTDGTVLEPAPGIRFPINEGPAFPNSQRIRPGGQGYPHIGLPRPTGGQNDTSNYSYPWQDNFCEYRRDVTAACPAQKGHYGQDIRPATCENGRYLAVAPEEITIRTIGTNHGVLAMGRDSGLLYSFLHLDRPLATHPRTGLTIKQGDILFTGEAIGRVSSRTDPVASCGAAAQYCTTLHLHFEIWSGAISNTLGSWSKGTNPLPPYASLVASYMRMLDSQPNGTDWVNEKPGVNASLCNPASIR